MTIAALYVATAIWLGLLDASVACRGEGGRVPCWPAALAAAGLAACLVEFYRMVA